MTAVYAIRHPQTTWNVAERYQGRLESLLSDEGRRQGRLVAEAFAPGDLDAVVSSPLGRARYLAEQVSRSSRAPVLVDQRLTEMAQGPWEGLHRSEIEKAFPEMYDRWYLAPDTVTFPGGENLSAVRDRGSSALRDVFTRWPGGQVAVITHAVVIQVLVATAFSMDLRLIHQLRVSNGGITTLCGTDAPGAVLSFNVTQPLYQSPVASATAQQCAGWKPRRLTT